ncbi:outer membrane lipid asymmetry maintenance protein MlaD [Vibrio albus]|jgi:phospholipid/cholesterol/gamma-HCH transport system substrate-binding protein|uniref:Outer membrane lipid asymmetry maintenance protein MlaD n=1 Tax=Vibrio albus TaxID=2200953 RepID=A0A2U3B9L7_9VIBR|nr:outer membrane lipid asymmetry maintenance protein MlaD [Vibrio albus]PWI33506.1 outer membrane lipid asymmetry maintenance protein MlaD [Vibrio albus]
MQQTRKLELMVGGFVLAGVIAVLVMIFKVANVTGLGSNDSYQLKAYFDNIGSLKVRSPVKIGGVVVGRVSQISLDSENYVPVVTLDISEEYGHFPETSSAEILTSGLIGEQYVSLIPGFVMDDIEMLGDGDFIEDTKSALVLEDLIGQVLYSINGSGEASK